jgi:TPR repeat protein
MKKELLILSIFFALASTSYANFQDGLKAYKGENYRAAFKEWKSLADEGDAESQYSLAHLYVFGKGTLKSYKYAIKYYFKAAKQNHPQAQLEWAKLALKIIKGNLIAELKEKDKLKAYKKVAEILSKLYENEIATDSMREEAEEIWNKHKLWRYQK